LLFCFLNTFVVPLKLRGNPGMYYIALSRSLNLFYHYLMFKQFCHSRMLLSGIHACPSLDPRLIHAGMTTSYLCRPRMILYVPSEAEGRGPRLVSYSPTARARTACLCIRNWGVALPAALPIPCSLLAVRCSLCTPVIPECLNRESRHVQPWIPA